MEIRRHCRWIVFATTLALVVGCGSGRPPVSGPPKSHAGTADGKSDPEQVRRADVSVLYVGNSHTRMHDLPDLVGDMIRYRHPERTVYWHQIWVSFLEDVARYPACSEEIESRPWKYVVLQAQKESQSGRF